jgi:HAD superfamily hydrolase (TIGR01450 family)
LLLEILAASFAAAAYLKPRLRRGAKVYILGEQGIADELDLMGIPNFGMADCNKHVHLGPGKYVEYDEHVAAVVAGYDPMINYYKLQYAQLCINNNMWLPPSSGNALSGKDDKVGQKQKCMFIATNLDQTSHQSSSQVWADAGATVGALTACTGVLPTVVGKPSSFLISYLHERYSIPPDRMCMVGDRLDTDVLFGLNNGMTTVLTLSGVATMNDYHKADPKDRPHFVINLAADLLG